MVNKNPKEYKKELEEEFRNRKGKIEDFRIDEEEVPVWSSIIGLVIGFGVCFLKCVDDVTDDQIDELVAMFRGLLLGIFTMVGIIISCILFCKLYNRIIIDKKINYYKEKYDKLDRDYETMYINEFNTQKEKCRKIFSSSKITEEIVNTQKEKFVLAIKEMDRSPTKEWVSGGFNIYVERDGIESNVGNFCEKKIYSFEKNRVQALKSDEECAALAEELAPKFVAEMKKAFPKDPAGGMNIISYTIKGSSICFSYRASNGNYVKERLW